MITEKWLKEELDKIDDRIYWEIEGCGNIEHVLKVFNKHLETQVKLCNKPAVIKSCENCKFDAECRHKQVMPLGYNYCKFYIEHVL